MYMFYAINNGLVTNTCSISQCPKIDCASCKWKWNDLFYIDTKLVMSWTLQDITGNYLELWLKILKYSLQNPSESSGLTITTRIRSKIRFPNQNIFVCLFVLCLCARIMKSCCCFVYCSDIHSGDEYYLWLAQAKQETSHKAQEISLIQ